MELVQVYLIIKNYITIITVTYFLAFFVGFVKFFCPGSGTMRIRIHNPDEIILLKFISTGRQYSFFKDF